jgi:hypothetical protein
MPELLRLAYQNIEVDEKRRANRMDWPFVVTRGELSGQCDFRRKTGGNRTLAKLSCVTQTDPNQSVGFLESGHSRAVFQRLSCNVQTVVVEQRVVSGTVSSEGVRRLVCGGQAKNLCAARS